MHINILHRYMTTVPWLICSNFQIINFQQLSYVYFLDINPLTIRRDVSQQIKWYFWFFTSEARVALHKLCLNRPITKQNMSICISDVVFKHLKGPQFCPNPDPDIPAVDGSLKTVRDSCIQNKFFTTHRTVHHFIQHPPKRKIPCDDYCQYSHKKYTRIIHSATNQYLQWLFHENGYIPETWKFVTLITIFKPGID